MSTSWPVGPPAAGVPPADPDDPECATVTVDLSGDPACATYLLAALARRRCGHEAASPDGCADGRDEAGLREAVFAPSVNGAAWAHP